MFNIITQRLNLAILLLVSLIGVVSADEQLLKMHNGESIGEVTLNKETMFTDARGVGRGYDITVQKDTKYFISVVTNGVVGKEYNLTVDAQNFIEGKVVLGNGWQAGFVVDLTNIASPKAIHLSKGNHTIFFTGKGPEVPFIERIKIAETEINAQLSAQDLISAFQVLASKTVSPDYLTRKANGTLGLTEAIIAATSDPLYKYVGATDVNVTYSFWAIASLTAGATATFQTSNSTVDPVMYVFYLDYFTSSYSWANDDGGGGYESRVSFTVPVTGNYVVALRSYYQGQTGTGKVLYNGSVWSTSAAIGGTMVNVSSYTSPGGTLNFFTSKPGVYPGYSYDSRLYVMPGFTSPVSGYNDDCRYGTFFWGSLSRVLASYSVEPQYCLVTNTVYASNPQTYDVYAKCSNSDIAPYFPNLNSLDAIKSADASGTYNCISWSGGVTTEWIWPPSDSRWNTGGGDLVSFNNYYKNSPTIRYSGAINYPYCVAPSTAGVEVDLWATGSAPNYSYTHGSTMKPGNNELHGYDWESKPGSLTRTFHPRNALNGTSYGAVVYSYKRAAGTLMAQGEGTGQAQTYDFAVTEKAKALGILRPLSLDSSIILGLTVKRNVSFNDAEKNKNSLLVNNLPASLKDEFTAKYSAWEKTWSDPKIAVFSNPREYAKSNEYGVLKDFCNNHGKDIWPLLFAKAQEQSSFIPLLLEDVLLSSSKTEMQAVDMEVGGNQFTYDGSFIYTTNKDRWVSLCKKLLNNF